MGSLCYKGCPFYYIILKISDIITVINREESINMNSGNKLYRMILSAMFLALALVLPFLTGQIQQIGNSLCPMHIPVILCGFICGPWYGLIVGAISPLLRFLLFGMPPIFPTGIAMSIELLTYGFCTGIFIRILPRKKINIYISLILSMLLGRIVWGIFMSFFAGFHSMEFGFKIFITKAFIDAIPGIIIQIILIPFLVMMINKSAVKE